MAAAKPVKKAKQKPTAVRAPEPAQPAPVMAYAQVAMELV